MLNLLIVDDESRHRDGLAKLIGRLKPGYRIYKAVNGVNALLLIEQHHMDIIIADIRMPKMDGLHLLERLESYERPFKYIILSGYRQFEYAQKALRLGACEYLVKPIDEPTILHMLTKVEREITESQMTMQIEVQTGGSSDVPPAKPWHPTLPIFRERLLNEWIKGFEEEEIVDAIRESNQERVASLIDQRFDKQWNDGVHADEDMKESMLRLLVNVAHAFKDSVQEDFGQNMLDDLERMVKNSATTAELKRAISDGLCRMIDHMASARNWKKEMILKKCIQYIDEHYAEDIHLDLVASQFHFNRSYFSHYFKANMGISFSQYLLRARLRKGKELLEQTDRKIYEISEMIGFRDTKYFYRVFKKEFGVTPKDYRRIIASFTSS